MFVNLPGGRSSPTLAMLAVLAIAFFADVRTMAQA